MCLFAKPVGDGPREKLKKGKKRLPPRRGHIKFLIVSDVMEMLSKLVFRRKKEVPAEVD